MTAKAITRNAIITALLAVSQVALAGIPNTELVSFLVILFTLRYGKDMFFVVEAFALIEILIYGLGMWNVMYLYVWAVPVAAVLVMKKYGHTSKYRLALLSGVFGLAFGTLCTVAWAAVYPTMALTWWISGLPFDLWHGISNFIIMILCYTPVAKVLAKL